MSVAICMWSGPRNLSTAMMRSFGSRADCAVWDEPFFAPFLKATGVDHPGRTETLVAHETDPDVVAKRCAGPAPGGEPYYFQKHMPRHMDPGFSLSWATSAKHFFLLREPVRVIASYAKGRENNTLADLGFEPQKRLFETLTHLTESEPPVIDSVDILTAPKQMLTALCQAIDIPFDPAMLAWEPGSRPEDGAWAPYWYHSVESSTGFGPPPTSEPVVPPDYADMLAACEADYVSLRDRRIRL